MKYLYTITLSMLLLYVCGCQKNIEIVAHRGNSGYAPENTLASVISGWQVDADIVEVDVYLTSDNKIVVIHDKDTKRTSGKKYIIAESDYAQIKDLDVGSFKSSYFKNEKIPLLTDVIATVPKGKRLFIEVKCGPEIISQLKQIIGDSRKDGLEIIAFDIEVVKESKRQMPNVPAYWVLSSPKDKSTGKYLPYDDSLIKNALKYNLDGLDLNYKSLSKDFVDKVHDADLDLYVWTVDHQPDAQHMKDIGVDGITTNYPAQLKISLAN